MPLAMYPIYIITQGLNVSWLVLFDRQHLYASLVVLALITFTLYLCLGCSLWGADRYAHQMTKFGLGRELWWVRLTVHNGLAVYATWVTIATLLNLAIVLIYETTNDPMDKEWREEVSTICLGILAFEMLLWFALDISFLDRYTRYVFTPQLVVTFALVGILVKNWDADSRNTYMEVAMLGAAALATVIKVVVILWRQLADSFTHQGATGFRLLA